MKHPKPLAVVFPWLLALLGSPNLSAQGTSLRFAGLDQVGVPLDPTSVVPTVQFTITGWVRVAAAELPAPGARSILLGRCSGSGGGGGAWAFVHRSDGTIAFAWEATPGVWREVPSAGTGSTLVNSWMFIGTRVDFTAGTVIMASDTSPIIGVGEYNAVVYPMASGDTLAASPLAGVVCPEGSASLVLGARLRGELDDFALWNTSLTSIYDVSLQPVSCSAPGLSSYWRFDDGLGLVAQDSGPARLPGALSSSLSGSGPFWTPSGAWGAGAAPDCSNTPLYRTGSYDLVGSGGRVSSPGYAAEATVQWRVGTGISSSQNYSALSDTSWMPPIPAAVEPLLLGVLPPTGLAAGGGVVRLLGENFTAPGAGTPSVRFGTRTATQVNVVSDTEVLVTTPLGTDTLLGNPLGGVEVRLTNAAGSSALPKGFRYLPEIQPPEVQPLPATIQFTLASKPLSFIVMSVGDVLAPNFGLPLPSLLAGQFGLLNWYLILDQSPMTGPQRLYTYPVPPPFVGVALDFQAASIDLFDPAASSFTNIVTFTAHL